MNQLQNGIYETTTAAELEWSAHYFNVYKDGVWYAAGYNILQAIEHYKNSVTSVVPISTSYIKFIQSI